MYARFSAEHRAQQAAACGTRASRRRIPAATAPVARAAVRLPLEVWSLIFAHVGDVRDVVALACTCRDAACCAWRELDLEAVDAHLEALHTAAHGPPVMDLMHGPAVEVNARSHASLGFARLLCVLPGAAATITRLALPVTRPLPLPVVAEFLRHCTSLRRLLNVPQYHHAETLWVLSAAADAGCPLEHAHVHTVTAATVSVLLRLAPTLRSLFVCFRANLYNALDIGALEQLLCRAPLTHVELEILGENNRLTFESDTLQELVLGGKGVTLHIRCPELRTIRLEGQMRYQHTPQVMADIVVGCPRMQLL